MGNTFGVLPGLVSSGECDAFIVGYDSAGNGLWTRQFGTRGWGDAKAVAVDGDGNLYMVGDTPGVFAGNSNLGRFDAYLRKYDRTGNELWTRQFGSQHFDFALDVVVAGTANVHVVGWTRGILPGQTHLGVFDAYLSTFDFEGIHLWSRQFGTQLDDSTSGLAVDGEGNFYVVGDTQGAFPGQVSLGLGDGFLSRMSGASAPAQAVDEIPTPTVMTAPDILWTRQFGTGTDDFAADIALDGEGNQYVAGNTFGVFPGENGSGGRDAYLLKHDVEGNQLWVRQFGSEINDDARDVEVDDAGNVYVLGSTSGSLPGWANLGMDDSYLRKYDADGNELWTRQFGTKDDDQARGLELDGAGNLYVVLQTHGEIANLTHVRELGEAATPKSVYLSKYDPNGNELWVRQFPSIIVELGIL